MANNETKILDSIIASRRSLLTGAGALAATALIGGGEAHAAVPATLTDTQVLNFALNLEYLEAQFYTIATEGATADASKLGGAIGTGAGTTASGGGTVTVPTATPAGSKVTFANANVQAYALEIAREERNHVNFLRGALGASAVAQPNINLNTSFVAVGTAAGVANFNPFLNDLTFLYGSYIFEDVGVTAYHGGALALSKTYLTQAAGIHAVEAYHAGMIRTLLANIDQGIITLPNNAGLNSAASTSTAISNARATLDNTRGTLPTDAAGLTGQDDFGVVPTNVPLNGSSATYQASFITDAGKLTAANATTYTYNTYIAPARTPQQVLNIVYISGTGAKSSSSFFPNGLNGDIN